MAMATTVVTMTELHNNKQQVPTLICCWAVPFCSLLEAHLVCAERVITIEAFLILSIYCTTTFCDVASVYVSDPTNLLLRSTSPQSDVCFVTTTLLFRQKRGPGIDNYILASMAHCECPSKACSVRVGSVYYILITICEYYILI